MFITKKFTFDSAHFLPNYSGKCRNLHGHTYILNITLVGEIDPDTGMIMDFSEIKNIVKEIVIDKLDHICLNDIIRIPTAENIVMWIFEKLKDKMAIYKIELWETSTSFVTYINRECDNK